MCVPVCVHLKQSGPQLFDGSDDDEEGGDEEQDGSRFDIRPEFEGRAGQKVSRQVPMMLRCMFPFTGSLLVLL